jgi:hypothetical protein
VDGAVINEVIKSVTITPEKLNFSPSQTSPLRDKIQFVMAGPLEVAADSIFQIAAVPFDCEIERVTLFQIIAGTSGTTVIDLRRNDISLYTSNPKPTADFADGNAKVYDCTLPDSIVLRAGDLLSAVIEDVEPAAAGAMLQVSVVKTSLTAIIDKVDFIIAGPLTVGADSIFQISPVPWDCTISQVTLLQIVAGSSGKTILDLKRNGATLYSSNPKPTAYATDDDGMVYECSLPNNTSLKKGDYLEVSVKEVQPDSVGAILRVSLVRSSTIAILDKAQFIMAGPLVAESDSIFQVAPVPFDCTISQVTLFQIIPGESGNTIVDLKCNGTTLYTSKTKPTASFEDGYGKVYDCELPDTVALSAGDYLEAVITEVEPGAAGAILQVHFSK